MNSPSPKPKLAPAIEPHSSPTAATSSGERSAGTPKIATCETVVSCRIPPTSPMATSRPMLVGGRLGQDLDEVELVQVCERRHVDRPVQVALTLDPLHLADRDVLRERRRQPLGDRAGRDDAVAGAYLLGLGHEVEQQVARRA